MIRRSWRLRKRLEDFCSGWYISEPGTLKKHESLSARAGSVRDVDSGNGGSERAGPPSGRPVCSIRKNIVLPGSGPTDLHYGKNGYVLAATLEVPTLIPTAKRDDCRRRPARPPSPSRSPPCPKPGAAAAGDGPLCCEGGRVHRAVGHRPHPRTRPGPRGGPRSGRLGPGRLASQCLGRSSSGDGGPQAVREGSSSSYVPL